jgi:hypothetical protein
MYNKNYIYNNYKNKIRTTTRTAPITTTTSTTSTTTISNQPKMTVLNNCFNSWGGHLAYDATNTNNSTSNRITISINPIETVTIENQLRTGVELLFDGKLKLQQGFRNGGQSNLAALNTLTLHNLNNCYLAAGSYLSGDGCTLHKYSTSWFLSLSPADVYLY